MARKNGHKIDGWINLYKPPEMGSTTALAIVKRVLKPLKAGHAGTLDPLAEGVLPLALGEATKTIPFMQDAGKSYDFTVLWGAETTTDDREGDVTHTSDRRPDIKDIEALLPQFIGEIAQVPPQFSAVKIAGKRAYDLARDEQEFEIQPKTVTIESLSIVEHRGDDTDFRVACGKGTYVRSLARDMGRALGCYGHAGRLIRTKVGPFTRENAISLDFLEENAHIADRKSFVLPLDSVLDDIPALELSTEEAARLRNGQALTFVSRHEIGRLEQAGLARETPHALIRVAGRPFGLVDVDGVTLRPHRLFNL